MEILLPLCKKLLQNYMKPTKYFVFISSLLFWALSAAYASPLVMIGDYVNVFFDGSSSLSWQSNIFYDDKIEKDELMLVMSPGLEAVIGNKLTGFDTVLKGNYEMQRFNKRSGLNDDYLHLSAISSYKGARIDLDAAYSFDEEQTTAGQQGASGSQFIEMDVTRAQLIGEYTLSPKFSFETGARYNDREFKDERDRLADVESFSIPVDIFYELTPKMDLSLGYEYTMDEVGLAAGDYDRESHFMNVGLRGALLPKLSGFFKIGYRTVNPEGATRNSDRNLGLSADFTYLTTPKITSELSLFRGFEVGSEGQSAENTSAKLNVNYSIASNYAANLFADLTYIDYKDGNNGEDFRYRMGFRFLYLPNQYWKFGTGYTYFENDSNRVDQGFVNHILDISASLRY